MSPLRLPRVLSLILLVSLGGACAPRPAPRLPASQAQLPASTPALLSPAAGEPYPPRLPEPLPSAPASSSAPASPASSDSSGINILLGSPTANSIRLSLLSSSDRQIVLAYGVQPGNYPLQTGPLALQANIPQNIDLTRLQQDTTYYYTLLAGGLPSPGHSFHTQRLPGSPFTFTIDADPHHLDPRFNAELYATTLANALHDRPDFHIDLGDTFMTEKARPQTYAEAESTFTELRPFFGILGADASLFLVNGNHEGELGWLLKGKAEDLPIWSVQLRQLYYPNPLPGGFYTGGSAPDPAVGIRDGYYAWTWGDALFVALDPFWYTTSKPRPDDPDSGWGWTLGKDQYDWLKSTLAASDARFKFVFIHHLVGGGRDARGGVEYAGLYEWGGNNADGSYGFDVQRPGWGLPLHRLLVENHVSAVFHGHDHVFVKQDLDGIVYQEVPQPSLVEYNKTRLAADYGYTHGVVLGSSGHLRITVTPEQVSVAYLRAYLPQDQIPGQQNGQVDYSYLILPP